MKLFRTKLMPYLLIATLVLSLLPMTVFAAEEPVVVSSPIDLQAAIDAIPEGGSGEITIKDLYASLDHGFSFEFKDITFNLVNASLSVYASPEGFASPVFFGYHSNLTVNLIGDSSLSTEGHTGNMGVVRVENDSWNNETQSYDEELTLTINGGNYTSSEILPDEDHTPDPVFCAAPGTTVVLSEVICNGPLEIADWSGVGINVRGKILAGDGRYTLDVSDYTEEGKYCGSYGDYYYVRDKEYTDAFNALLTDGKLVFRQVRPESADEEHLWVLADEFNMAHEGEAMLLTEYFTEDLSQCAVALHEGQYNEEIHTVPVEWVYDADVEDVAKEMVADFPDDREWFNVTDLELVNYWVYNGEENEEGINTLANFSGELKKYLNNSNFTLIVDYRGGSDEVFVTERIGSAKLMHGGVTYMTFSFLGAKAEHVLYVPESTADTKQALMEAAQKRIDDYIGAGKVTVTAGDTTVAEYYAAELAAYDAEISRLTNEIAQKQALIDAIDPNTTNPTEQMQLGQWRYEIMNLQMELNFQTMYKEGFEEAFEEGGYLSFLNDAAGGYLFNVQVAGKQDVYPFVIVKNDDKITVPSYATVDLNTQVSVTTDSPTVPLDTVVEVNKLTEGAEYDRILSVLNVKHNETFDINLYSASRGQYVTKLEDGTFEVKLPIPETLKGKTLIVYYVDENGTPVEYTVTPQGNFAVFTTNHFSIYTLAEKVVTETVTPPPTSDNTGLWLWLSFALVSMTVLCGTLILRRGKKA